MQLREARHDARGQGSVNTVVDEQERRAPIALASVDGIGPEIFWKTGRRLGRRRRCHRACSALVSVRRWARRPPLCEQPAAGQSGRRSPKSNGLAGTMDKRLREIDDAGLWTLTASMPTIRGGCATWIPSRRSSTAWAIPPCSRTAQCRGRGHAAAHRRRPRCWPAKMAARLVEAEPSSCRAPAVGIDGAAHAATLAAGGATIGVIGGGHHQPGPRAHRDLRAADRRHRWRPDQRAPPDGRAHARARTRAATASSPRWATGRS